MQIALFELKGSAGSAAAAEAAGSHAARFRLATMVVEEGAPTPLLVVDVVVVVRAEMVQWASLLSRWTPIGLKWTASTYTCHPRSSISKPCRPPSVLHMHGLLTLDRIEEDRLTVVLILYSTK
jgi:hypothetical protein